MAKRIIFSLLGVIIFLALCPCSWGRDSTIATARVIRTKGTTMVYHHDSDEWSVAKKEMRLVQSDTIKTLSDSEVDLLIEDVAVIRLKANTTLELAEIGREASKPAGTSKAILVDKKPSDTVKNKVLKLMKGKVLLWVRYVVKGSVFEVQTSIGVAGVRGTRFLVGIYEDTTTVATLEGIVIVGNIQMPDKTVTLRAKETAIVVKGEYPSEAKRVSEKEYSDLKETLELRLPRQDFGFKRKPGSKYDGVYSSSNICWDASMSVSGDCGTMPMPSGTSAMGGGSTTMEGGTSTMGTGSTTVRGGSTSIMSEPVRSPVDNKSCGSKESKRK